MAQLVDGFLQQTLIEQFNIWTKAVELLAEAVKRDQCAGAAHLGFAENVLQNWNVEIDTSNAQQAPILGMYKGLHAFQDFGRVILQSFGVVGRGGIQLRWEDFAVKRKTSGDGSAQSLEK